MNIPMKLSVAALVCLSAAAAQAQSAGTLMGRIGATNISPSVTSGDLTAPAFAGTKADVGDASQISGGITYMMTDNIALDLPLALPFKHNIVGDGAIAGVGKLGETKALPVTLLVQYRFGDAKSDIRPYVGAGPTYARFFKTRTTAALSALTGGTPATPTTMSIDSKLVPTIQAGVSVNLKDGWFIDAMVAKTFLETRSTLSTGQTLDMKLNPTSFSIGVGRRF